MSDRNWAWIIALASIAGATIISSMGGWGAGWLIFVAVLTVWALLASD